jgi:hypothetical protein
MVETWRRYFCLCGRNKGPSQKELNEFEVPEDGGALQRLNKDTSGNITLKIANI